MHVPILDVLDVDAVDTPKPITITQPDSSKKGKSTGIIRADIQLDKAGYLKGEQIRLKIKVQHTKPIKNLNGVVVTLYRMSRFDSPR
jgi:arrestin-related trafficking adapter 9